MGTFPHGFPHSFPQRNQRTVPFSDLLVITHNFLHMLVILTVENGYCGKGNCGKVENPKNIIISMQ